MASVVSSEVYATASNISHLSRLSHLQLKCAWQESAPAAPEAAAIEAAAAGALPAPALRADPDGRRSGTAERGGRSAFPAKIIGGSANLYGGDPCPTENLGGTGIEPVTSTM